MSSPPTGTPGAYDAYPCPPNTALSDALSLLVAQRDDVQILRDMTADALAEFDTVLALVREGSPFVRTLVSGELRFEQIFEGLVRSRSTFRNFYVQSCMVTIAAAKAGYPVGFEFLEDL